MRAFRVVALLLVGVVSYLGVTSATREPQPIAQPTEAASTPAPNATPTPQGRPVVIPTPSPRQTHDQHVEILDDLYSPLELAVPVGTTVVWRNFGSRAHDIQSRTDAWHTLVLEPGQTARVGFNAAGTFEYVCSFHASMQARVVVVN